MRTTEVSVELLELHNLYRESSGVDPLRWSSELADLAAAYAGFVRDEYNCEGVVPSPPHFRSSHARAYNPDAAPQPPPVPHYYVGETIAWRNVPQATTEGVADDFDTAMSRWYGELGGYVYGRIGEPCTFPAATEHTMPTAMTQLLWHATIEVGCAVLTCPDTHPVEDISTWLMVCEYGPGGNLLGELPFSPTVARKLGLRPEPCDGALSRAEWERLEGIDPNQTIGGPDPDALSAAAHRWAALAAAVALLLG